MAGCHEDQKKEKQIIVLPKITPEVSTEIDYSIKKNFNSNSAGLFYFWPFIKQFGIDEIIQKSGYPDTKNISKLSSIMSFPRIKDFKYQTVFSG